MFLLNDVKKVLKETQVEKALDQSLEDEVEFNSSYLDYIFIFYHSSSSSWLSMVCMEFLQQQLWIRIPDTNY